MRFQGRGSARSSKFDFVGGLIAGIGLFLTFITFVGSFIFSAPDAIGGTRSIVPGGIVVPIAIFVTTWVTLVVFGIVRSVANVVSDEGVPHETSEFSGEISSSGASSNVDFADKLRELQALKDDGLITEEEFAMKRKQILAKEW